MKINLTPGFSQVRSQGNFGASTAFAATAILEYLRNRIDGNFSDPKPHFSPRFVWFNGRPGGYYNPGVVETDCTAVDHKDYPKDIDIGHSIWTLSELKQHGACDESDWPWEDCEKDDSEKFRTGPADHYKNDFAKLPDAATYNKAKIAHQYFDDIKHLGTDPDDWIKVIRNDLPVFFRIRFSDELKNISGERVLDDMSNPKPGTHAVVLCGYDSACENPDDKTDKFEAFLVRNSWGERWGRDGYLWVKKELLESLQDPDGHYYFTVDTNRFKHWPFYDEPSDPLSPPHVVPPPPPRPPTRPQPVSGRRAPSTRPPQHGDFMYTWWLMKKDDFDKVKARNLSPNSVTGANIGKQILNPTGCSAKDESRKNKKHSEFTDQSNELFDQNNAGMYVVLGACKVSEARDLNQQPEDADIWKWALGKQLPTVGPLDIRLTPLSNATDKISIAQNNDIKANFVIEKVNSNPTTEFDVNIGTYLNLIGQKENNPDFTDQNKYRQVNWKIEQVDFRKKKIKRSGNSPHRIKMKTTPEKDNIVITLEKLGNLTAPPPIGALFHVVATITDPSNNNNVLATAIKDFQIDN